MYEALDATAFAVEVERALREIREEKCEPRSRAEWGARLARKILRIPERRRMIAFLLQKMF